MARGHAGECVNSPHHQGDASRDLRLWSLNKTPTLRFEEEESCKDGRDSSP